MALYLIGWSAFFQLKDGNVRSGNAQQVSSSDLNYNGGFGDVKQTSVSSLTNNTLSSYHDSNSVAIWVRRTIAVAQNLQLSTTSIICKISIHMR